MTRASLLLALVLSAGARLVFSQCPYEVTAWSQWFGDKDSSGASYVDGTSAFLTGGKLQLLMIVRDAKSGCVTGVRTTHSGKTSSELGLAWPQRTSAERTSSILELSAYEVIQKAEIWLKPQSSTSDARCIAAMVISTNTTRQWAVGKPTSDAPLVAVANRKAGFLAAIRGFDFPTSSASSGAYLPALQFVWAAPSPGCITDITNVTVKDIPESQKVKPLKDSCPDNLLVNGGFEAPKLEDVIAFPDPEKVPGFGWSVKNCLQLGTSTGNSAVEIQREDHPFTITPFWNPEGANRIELAPDAPQSICQVVQTKPGQKYQLCLLHRKRTDTGPSQNTITTARAGLPGKKLQELLVIRLPAYSSDTWRQHCVTFTATSSALQLAIGDQSIDNFPGCGTMLDAVCLRPLT